MHRVAKRRVTYLWMTIALALIAALAVTHHHIAIPGEDANGNCHVGPEDQCKPK